MATDESHPDPNFPHSRNSRKKNESSPGEIRIHSYPRRKVTEMESCTESSGVNLRETRPPRSWPRLLTDRWRRGRRFHHSLTPLLLVSLLTGCGTLKTLTMGELEIPVSIRGDRESSEGLSFLDSTIGLDGVEGDAQAWALHSRSASWATAKVPGTNLANFRYGESEFTFGSDGSGNVPDGGVRYRGARGRELILVGSNGAFPWVPDPDETIDDHYQNSPPRLTMLLGTSFTTSTIGAGEFHGLGLETGLRWRQPLMTSAVADSDSTSSALHLTAEYTRGAARSFRSSDGARGEQTERGQLLLGFTPADSSRFFHVGWKFDRIHQYGGLDQDLDFSGPIIQMGWELGPKRRDTDSQEPPADADPES